MADLFKLLGTIAVDCGDSKTKIDDVTTSAKDLSEKLGGVGSEADNTSGKFKDGSKFHTASVWLGNVLSKLTEKAVNLVYNLGKIGFDFNTNMESYQFQFEALIGDAEKASQLIADLQELAKISPLGMEGLANNAVMLLQSGQELTDIVPTLEMLGNLSLGNTDRMNSVVRAYTQILGKGGLMAQEMYQLGDAMVPIVEIMTKYGGEKYADRSWYQAKMTDPTYKIPAEDMVKAFNAATAEGGKWHDYMLTIMDSFAGQTDRLGEEGKETLGAFFQPFFEVAKSEVLHRLIDSLAAFRTWVDENKESITAFAEALGGFVVEGFDKALALFQWIVENKSEAAAAFNVIAVAVSGLVAATHPWLATIAGIVAYLAAVNDLNEKVNEFNEKMGGNRTVGEYLSPNATGGMSGLDLINAFNGNIEVGAELKEGAAEDLQSELNGMDLQVDVDLNPVSTVHPSGSGVTHGGGAGATWHAEGAIFSKPTLFNTRLGLHGVGEAGPEAVAPIEKLQQYVSDAVNGAIAGLQLNVVLDTGVLVGQISHGMDKELGSIAGRKGRRN